MKKLMILFVAFMLTLTLAGCKRETKNLDDYDIVTEFSGEPVEVSFWHAFGQDKEATIREYADAFEDLYPNVTITMLSQGGYTDLRSKVVKSIVTGETPTMLIGYPDHVADYLEGEAILSLDPFINDDEVGFTDEELDDFVDSYLAENKQFGKTMGLPFNKSTEVLIYNKTYFDANNLTVPTTWDELKTVSQSIKADTGKWGFAYDSTSNLFITLTRQWGGEYTNADGELLFDNAETKAALTFYKEMYDAGLATTPATWEQNYASEPFKAKNVYMTIGSTAGISYNVPANESFEIGVAPIPQKDENSKAVIQQGTNLSIMANSTDEERLAAWLFIKYLSSEEITTDWAIKTGYLPVRKSALDSDDYQEFLDTPKDFEKYTSMAANAAYAQVDYMFYDTAFVGSAAAREEVGYAVEAILYGGKTVDQAIDDAIAELDW